MSPSEYLITGLFEVNNMQSGISLLIFLDYMHSKLPIFWNLVKKLTFLLSFLLLSKGLVKVNWVTKGELLRVVIKVGYKMSINSAQLLRFSISIIPCNGNQCPLYCPWSIVRSSWQDELSSVCFYSWCQAFRKLTSLWWSRTCRKQLDWDSFQCMFYI